VVTWTPFNINDHVRVKITARGARVWEGHWRSYGLEPPPIERDADGYTELQAHGMMRIFGADMSVGIDPPIETEILVKLL